MDPPPLPPPATFQFTALNYTVSETGGSVTLTVSFSGKTNQQPVSVDYATSDDAAVAGSDYTQKSGTLTFAPGEQFKTFSVAILNDALTEGDEKFIVTLSNPVGGALGNPSVASVTILDDETPSITVQFSASGYAVDESQGSATITASLSASSAQQVTVNYATSDGSAKAPDDYQSTSGTLTFAAGETAKTFAVPIVSDDLIEQIETVELALSNPTNAAMGSPSSATLTIVDDDFPLTVQFAMSDFSVSEGSSATITVTLSAWTTKQVTVAYATSDGTATAGDDYDSASGTLTFPAGAMSQTFAVATKVDSKVEADETVQLTLSNPTNADLGQPSTATLTIMDRGAPVLTISPAPSAICSGAVADSLHQSTITAILTDGTDPFVGATVSFSTNRGTLSASSAVTDDNGQAEVTLTSDKKASETPALYLATVTVQAGPATATCDVEFQPTQVTLTAAPAEVLIGEKAGLTASVTWNGQAVAQHALKWSISRVWDKDGNLVYDGTGTPPPGYGSLADEATQTDPAGKGTAVFQTGSLAGKAEFKVADQSVAFMTSLGNPSAVAQVVISGADGVGLQAVTFSVKNHALVSDFGAPFDDPQWTPYRSYPVAYTRNTKVTASAKNLVNPAPAMGTKIKIKGVSTVIGVGNVPIAFKERELDAPGGSIITYPATDANVALLDKIQYIETFLITWTVSIDDELQPTLLTNSNQFYVTWGDPEGSPTMHTVIHTGCFLGDGQGGQPGIEDDKALAKIWAGKDGWGFVKKKVQKAPDGNKTGHILTYYGFKDKNNNGQWDGDKTTDPQGPDEDWNGKTTKTTPSGTWENLVERGNGDCGCWQGFLLEVLRKQKLGKVNGVANLPVSVPIKAGKEYLVVQEWAKTNKGPPRKIVSPLKTASKDTENNSWIAGVDGTKGTPGYCGRKIDPKADQAEAADMKGVPGQGTSPNPLSYFGEHQIVLAGGKYYDPSYGLGPKEYDNDGIAAK